MPYWVVSSSLGESMRVAAEASPVTASVATDAIATTPNRRIRSPICGDRRTAWVARARTPPPHAAAATVCRNPLIRASECPPSPAA